MVLQLKLRSHYNPGATRSMRIESSALSRFAIVACRALAEHCTERKHCVVTRLGQAAASGSNYARVSLTRGTANRIRTLNSGQSTSVGRLSQSALIRFDGLVRTGLMPHSDGKCGHALSVLLRGGYNVHDWTEYGASGSFDREKHIPRYI